METKVKYKRTLPSIHLKKNSVLVVRKIKSFNQILFTFTHVSYKIRLLLLEFNARLFPSYRVIQTDSEK